MPGIAPGIGSKMSPDSGKKPSVSRRVGYVKSERTPEVVLEWVLVK